jgi:hypothetical protein
MNALKTFCLALAALASIAAHANDFVLPSTRFDETMVVAFGRSSPEGKPIAGVPFVYTILEDCGTFGGRSSVSGVTGADGSFPVVFTPRIERGFCRMQIRDDFGFINAATQVYRPEDVVIGISQPIHGFLVGVPVPAQFDVGTALGPLAGKALTFLEAGSDGAATGTFVQRTFATDQSGRITGEFRPNPVPGIYDLRFFTVEGEGAVRVVQLPPSSPTRLQEVAAAMYPTEGLIRIAGPSSSTCELEATFWEPPGHVAPPEGTVGFPFGSIYASFGSGGCASGSSLPITLEYRDPLPADAYFVVSSSSGGAPWTRVPSVVNGNRITFTLVAGGRGDSFNIPGRVDVTGGITRDGAAPEAAAIPTIRDMWWSGAVENGWGMSILQSADGNAFSVIYAYDHDGNPTWWVMPTGQWTPAGRFLARAYVPRGTPWYAYSARRTYVGESVGNIALTPAGPDAATLDLVFDGVTMRKALQRQRFGREGTPPLTDLTGMWWGGPAQSGWGVAILQQKSTLFSVWFTYDDSNRPTWFVMPDGVWTDASTYEGRLYRTHGSPWLGTAPYDASSLRVKDVGPYRLRFEGINAKLDFTVDGRAGSLALTRQHPF